MHKLWILSFLVVGLQGCASTPFPPETSQNNLGALAIKQPLTIAADKARVSIQAGKVVDHVDAGDPVCVLESWQRGEVPQTIQPEAFRISQIDYRQGDVSDGFGFYGSNDGAIGTGIGFRLGGWNMGADPMAERYARDRYRVVQAAVIMRIVSSTQPLIYKLSCYSAQGWVSSVAVPTEAEMQQTLGELATLALVGKK